MDTNEEIDGSGDGKESVVKVCQGIQQKAMAAIRVSNSIPTSEFGYYHSFPAFASAMASESKQILSMMSGVANNYSSKTIKKFSKAKDDSERMDILIDLNDFLLDRASNAMDDVEGLKKRDRDLVVATLQVHQAHVPYRNATDNRSSQASTSSGSSTATNNYGTKDFKLVSSKTIERPQISFPDKINNDETPFVPRITYKPNSLKPLAILPEATTDSGIISYCHPYEFEIDRFEPTDQMLECVEEPLVPRKLDETPFFMVDTKDDLECMMVQLMKSKEMAVDLEHHSFRSYQGFTCLIQISTRDEDYVVDALKLRSELHVLNEVFTDARIVKVFHGSDSDVIWLQRDFGVYIVGMFDTHMASRVLGLAHHSLAHLMKSYCGIEVNKEFQLADWRMRPLDSELLKYAREDTHYLLYIYDRMKYDLIQRGNANFNLLRSVFKKSALICLKKYEKSIFDSESLHHLIRRNNITLNSRQMFALEKIYSWRDRVARIEDESHGYVLPNHMMLKMAEILPREMHGILSCCSPIPPLVKQQLNELHAIILKAREVTIQPLDKDAIRKKLLNRTQLPVDNRISNIFDKHDPSLNENYTPDPILERDNPETSSQTLEMTKLQESHMSKFMDLLFSKTPVAKSKSSNSKKYTSPYERFVRSLKQKGLEAEKKEKEPKVAEVKQEDKTDGNLVEDVIKIEPIRKFPMYHNTIISDRLKSIRNQSEKRPFDNSVRESTSHDYKKDVDELFSQPSTSSGNPKSKSGGQKFYDPHGDFMSDRNKRHKSGHNSSQKSSNRNSKSMTFSHGKK